MDHRRQGIWQRWKPFLRPGWDAERAIRYLTAHYQVTPHYVGDFHNTYRYVVECIPTSYVAMYRGIPAEEMEIETYLIHGAIDGAIPLEGECFAVVEK